MKAGAVVNEQSHKCPLVTSPCPSCKSTQQVHSSREASRGGHAIEAHAVLREEGNCVSLAYALRRGDEKHHWQRGLLGVGARELQQFNCAKLQRSARDTLNSIRTCSAPVIAEKTALPVHRLDRRGVRQVHHSTPFSSELGGFHGVRGFAQRLQLVDHGRRQRRPVKVLARHEQRRKNADFQLFHADNARCPSKKTVVEVRSG